MSNINDRRWLERVRNVLPLHEARLPRPPDGPRQGWQRAEELFDGIRGTLENGRVVVALLRKNEIVGWLEMRTVTGSGGSDWSDRPLDGEWRALAVRCWESGADTIVAAVVDPFPMPVREDAQHTLMWHEIIKAAKAIGVWMENFYVIGQHKAAPMIPARRYPPYPPTPPAGSPGG